MCSLCICIYPEDLLSSEYMYGYVYLLTYRCPRAPFWGFFFVFCGVLSGVFLIYISADVPLSACTALGIFPCFLGGGIFPCFLWGFVWCLDGTKDFNVVCKIFCLDGTVQKDLLPVFLFYFFCLDGTKDFNVVCKILCLDIDVAALFAQTLGLCSSKLLHI